MERRSFLAIVTTLAMLGFAAPAHADALADIMESGTLKVAVPQDFPPFGSVGLDLESVGYDIDMAKLIADKLGVSVELVPVTSANRIPYLQTGMVDLVISSLGKNPEREAVIDFTDAYAPFFNGVFGPDSINVASVEELSGYTIGVTRGAVEDLTLTELVGSDVSISRYEDNNGTISAFLSSQVDLIATGNVVAAAILERNPPIRPELKFLVQNSPCYIGLNKEEPELLAAVNTIIADAKADGSLEAIAQKWLGQPLPADL
ncbi:transporter substrate-binding domain-containing protein [Pelagibacterium halotolerans]|uniref:ABC-type amino acid transport/signal transduction systems, periplasmic component/domain protein n=1 Tax=Pelagibacterium halotolerans (strain DSM 22347 / JCM 15775 / CGMCC 1.7692 / B2) TaxID=1082931 RepID=G4RDH9_PELHB|nr:transporter substrate-binding domain-containing protein [Pelagibacterium halotolerans]AEQ51780.1 ABC-type amino acid transport/signal transduction systems, periplasmic component/domain protein [Pelagibacterium halotolerans B2]QJR18408.1 transporter substrate-binding domain-containing protein [Pelagibacterium halotolerans]SEA23234.1 amino acid ABC transporter substrate-binding protein, PAAT family [Pelagibacterium halotolerans]